MRDRTRVKLADVAARAGVSVTTASYILNRRAGEMRISAEAVARVDEAATALKYRPNRLARNLRSSSTATIGVISDHLAGGAFASEMLTGAAAAARRANRLLLIGDSGGSPEVERLLVEEMLDRQVDGVVYATVATATVTVPATLRTTHTMLLNCTDPDSGLPAVLPDELGGGRTAAGVLVGAGRCDGIHVVGEETTPDSIAGPLRMEGIVACLDQVGGSVAGTIPCAWSVTHAFEALSAELDAGLRPRALVCLNDRIAMGVYDALREHGLRVGVDVPVVSFDGSDLATWLRPTLTSVGIPFAALGDRAVTGLLREQQGTELVSMPLLCGESVGPASEHDALQHLGDQRGDR